MQGTPESTDVFYNYLCLQSCRFKKKETAMETYRKKEQIKTFSWMISTIFSVIDEILQTFVPGRSGMFWDILIDQFGILLALIATVLFLSKKLKLLQ